MALISSLVAQVIIINAPLGAGFVWKAASVFLPPSTRQKINILSRGSSGLAELHRLVRPHLWHCLTSIVISFGSANGVIFLYYTSSVST